MSNFRKFLKDEKWTIWSMCLTLIAIFTGIPGLFGAEGAPGVVVTEEGVKATPGTAGLNTQVPGSPTTVSAVEQAGGDLVQPDIDEQIFMVGTDETVLDGLMRKCKRKVKVTGYEVDHYVVDEEKAYVETTGRYAGSSQKQASLTVSSDDAQLFQEYGTVVCRGVPGYSEDGQTKIPASDLMLFIVKKSDESGMPIVRAVNGPKTSPGDTYCNVPEIPAGTKLILCSNACAETQKEVAPDTIVPVPQRVYLQKTVMNQVVSDYFGPQKKRIPFNEAQIAEAMVKKYRLKNNRTLWIGRKSKFLVDRGKMGPQYVYTTEGMRWQFKREWEHKGPWTFADIIALSKLKFTGQNCSKKALWIMGRDLLEGIQNIDFTKHKDITMVGDTVWGFACTRLHTIFGDIYLLHDPTLDKIGYSNSGGLIDESGLVRYYIKNEESSQDDVEGEEAKRKAVISINALALKGYSHIWVNCETTSDGLPGVTLIKEWNNASEAPAKTKGQVYYLKQKCTGISGSSAAGEMWQWDGSMWKKYNEEIFAKDESL